jgi:RimJ/RimL family protein N-acetyltransferase
VPFIRFGRLRTAWRRIEARSEQQVISLPERPLDQSSPMPELPPLLRGGRLVDLRRHDPSNLEPFQRWYEDEEIARMLRHDQQPLNDVQSRGYFQTLILPATARNMAYAIHERSTGRLIGATALTDFEGRAPRSAYFRIVIGEKDVWGKGYGTEATRLVILDGFDRHHLDIVKLEVFKHNERARKTYARIGFRVTGEHVEFVGRDRFRLEVIEMEIDRSGFAAYLEENRSEGER